MTRQRFAILLGHVRRAQAPTERVLQIVHPQAGKSRVRRSAVILLPLRCGSLPRGNIYLILFYRALKLVSRATALSSAPSQPPAHDARP